VRHLGKLLKIFRDLRRADDDIGIPRRLPAAERRIGYAVQLLCGIDQRMIEQTMFLLGVAVAAREDEVSRMVGPEAL
jgi:hypothetical protein